MIDRRPDSADDFTLTLYPDLGKPGWNLITAKINDMDLFDKGWNALRDMIFDNQNRLGVIPQDAKMRFMSGKFNGRVSTFQTSDIKVCF